MTRSIRLHHCSDGGSMEIGTSEKTVIEVGGQKFALSMLATLADPKNVGQTFTIATTDGVVGIEAHACPLVPALPAEAPPAKRARRKETTEE